MLLNKRPCRACGGVIKPSGGKSKSNFMLTPYSGNTKMLGFKTTNTKIYNSRPSSSKLYNFCYY